MFGEFKEESLKKVLLHKKAARNAFNEACDIAVDADLDAQPLPDLIKELAPHLRTVVQQYTGMVGRTKLKAASLAVNWKLANMSQEEIEGFMKTAATHAAQNVNGQSKDALEIAQKFLDGLSPEAIQKSIDTNKNAITDDMIEDVIVVLAALKSVLPKKLNGYLHDLIPEVEDFETIIRKEAKGFVSAKSEGQIKNVLDAAKQTTKDVSDVSDQVVSTGQSTLLEKLDELEPAQIKRIIDYVSDKMTRTKISHLMQVFFAFADEVLAAFEEGGKPIREYEFKHGAEYREAIAEFLQFVEDALDAEGVLPDQLDKTAIRNSVQEVAPLTNFKKPIGPNPK